MYLRGFRMKQKVVKIKEGEAYITLNVLLKLTGIINTGGQAKYFLQENEVLVNGELENRRGRKLYPGDVIDIKNQSFKVE